MATLNCITFKPFQLLVKAYGKSCALTNEEVQAYECACNQFGRDRVALQEDDSQFVSSSAMQRGYVIGSLLTLENISKEDLNLQNLHRRFCTTRMPSRYNIYIHWPEITIENERDQSIVIKDFFARVPLYVAGLQFEESELITFMKTSYSRTQWNCGYTHSHMQSPSRTRPMTFRHYCLGTGPILSTIRKLKRNPENQEATMLFFWELDKLVHVESLTGIPYIRLESVRGNQLTQVINLSFGLRNAVTLDGVSTSGYKWLRDFIISFLKTVDIPLSYANGRYAVACSFAEFSILLSNYYKKWRDAMQQTLKIGGHIPIHVANALSSMDMPMITYVVKDNALWLSSGRMNDAQDPSIRNPFVFNSEEFRFTIYDDENTQDLRECRLLNAQFVGTVLQYINTTINLLSTKDEEENQQEGDQSNQSGQVRNSGQSLFISSTEQRDYGQNARADSDSTPIG